MPEQKEDKGSPPPHIDTLFRSSFHSDFNLLASPLTKPSSLFSQLSFSSDSTLPMSPPAPSSPLVHDARSTAGTAAAGGVDDVIDADDTTGLGLLVADLSLANESVNGIDHASSYYGLAVPAITHRRSSTQRSYPLGSPGTNLPTDPTPTAAGMNGLQSHPNVQLQTLPCDLRGGEHPYGEHPSRTLFVRNIHSSVDDEELRILFSVTQILNRLFPLFVIAVAHSLLLLEPELWHRSKFADSEHVHTMQASRIRDDILL